MNCKVRPTVNTYAFASVLIRQIICFLFLLILPVSRTSSQTHPNFNVRLQIDYEAAEQTVMLFGDQPVSTQQLAELRGNRIAASTTGLIADRSMVSVFLRDYLDSLKSHQIIRDDIYHLENARDNASEIGELLTELKRRNFSRRVIATVEQIFPPDARVDITIPVYVVALGHENVDAYVRRIIWHGSVPEFVGEGEGELTIVLNLAQSVNYGSDLEERVVSLLGVTAHEVFHAAFGAFKDQSSAWKRFYRKFNRPIDMLLDITQNEGIAYYLSLDQRGRGFLPRDWNSKMNDVFRTFNSNALELLSDRTPRSRVAELIRTANLSGYWESYGSMAGMFMAREIDIRLGRASLIETISHGPADLLLKYASLTRDDSNLPRVDPRLIKSSQER